jgi:NADP-dependent 3-hydroxy acid dehydrogenase YdfG
MDTSVAPVVSVDLDSLQSFAGKTIIVTGASSGIGLEIAEFFYDLGCNVVFVGGRKRPDTYVDLDSSRTLVCQCDISSWDSQVEIFEAAKQKFGHIDIVCLNAGIAEPRGQFFDVKVDQTGKPLPPDLRVLDVDLKGTVYGVALGFHYLREGGGTIIMVTSRAGYGGNEIMPGYSAAKNGEQRLFMASSVHHEKSALTFTRRHGPTPLLGWICQRKGNRAYYSGSAHHVHTGGVSTAVQARQGGLRSDAHRTTGYGNKPQFFPHVRNRLCLPGQRRAGDVRYGTAC